MSTGLAAVSFGSKSLRARSRRRLLRASIEALEERKYLYDDFAITKTGGLYEGDYVTFDLDVFTDRPSQIYFGTPQGGGNYEEGIDYDWEDSIISPSGFLIQDDADLVTVGYWGNYWDWDPEFQNVAPNGWMENSGPVNEGSPVTVTMNASDVSPTDNASLRYSFSTSLGGLAGDYGSAGTSSSVPFTFNDNGTVTVYGRVFDKDGGYSDSSTTVTVANVAPYATLGITEHASNGSVTIALSGPNDPSSVDHAAGYKYAFSSDFNSLPIHRTGAGTTTSRVFTAEEMAGLSQNALWARIFDINDGYRTYNVSVPPLDVTAAGTSQHNLTWTDTATGETGWKIQVSTDGTTFTDLLPNNNLLSANSIHYEVSVPDGTRRWYRIRAVGTPGTAGDTIYSPKDSATTDLAAPTNVVAVADPETGEGTIQWIDNSASEEEYTILQSTDGVNFTEIEAVSPDVTSFDLEDLTPSTQYMYRIETRKSGLAAASSILTGMAVLGVNELRKEIDPGPQFIYTGLSAPEKQKLTIKFNQDISGSIQDSDIVLENLWYPGVQLTDLNWTYNSTSKTLTITFEDVGSYINSTIGTINGALPDGPYELRILAGSVISTETGLPLAEDAGHEFFFMMGDANHDRYVDARDLVILDANWFGTGKQFSQADFNYDGSVNQVDLTIMAAKWGAVIPEFNTFNVIPVTSDTIQLTWEAPGYGHTVYGWRVQRSLDGQDFEQVGADLPASQRWFNDMGLQDGKRYWYRVYEIQQNGSSPNQPYTYKIGGTTRIVAPSALSAPEVHAESVVLEWTPESIYEIGFKLYTKLGGTWDSGITLDPGTTWHEVTGLDPLEDYEFKLVALGEDANSMETLPFSVTTHPPQPTLESVTFGYDNDFLVTGEVATAAWDDKSIVVEMSLDGGDFTELGEIDWTDPEFNNGSVPIDLNDLEGTVITIRVHADAEGEESDVSNEIAIVVPPSAPGGLSETSSDTDSVDLSWTDYSNHEEGFELVVTPADGSDSWSITLDANAETYTLAGLNEAMGYHLELWSFANGVRSETSTEATVTTKLSAPAAVWASAVSPFEINLTWSHTSPAEDGFIIKYRDVTANATGQTVTAPVNATGYPSIGLYPEHEYEFAIMAFADRVLNTEPVRIFSAASVASDTTLEDTSDDPRPDPGKAPPPPDYPIGMVYRLHLEGDPYAGPSNTDFVNLGNLALAGGNEWSSTPPTITSQFTRDHVAGTITSWGTAGWDPLVKSYTYPEDDGGAFTTSSGAITFEDTYDRNNPVVGPHDGEWLLSAEPHTIDANDPNSTSGPPEPASGDDPLPYVYIDVVDDEGAEEDEDVLTFRVSRWQYDLSNSLTVQLFDAAGRATSGDYETEILNSSDSVIVSAAPGLPSSVTIPAGDEYVTVRIIPIDDDVFEGTETVFAILKASPSNLYWLTTAFMAQAQIADNDVEPIDIRVDSNNDGKIDATDDAVEATGTGQILVVNTDDTDQDGVADYSDGFNRFSDDSRDNVDMETFKAAQLRLPDSIDPAIAKIRFVYSESVPSDVSRTGDWAQGERRQYTLPESGKLRLWKNVGYGTSRSSTSVQSGGDRIPNDVAIDASKIFGTSRSASILMEAVKTSTDGELSIAMWVDPLGNDNFTLSDTVKLTSRERQLPVVTSVVGAGGTSITLNWTHSFSEKGYRVLRQDGFGWDSVAGATNLPSTTRSHTITGLQFDRLYSFRVIALNAGGGVQHREDDSTPIRVYTGTTAAKTLATQLFSQAEDHHRYEPYYTFGSHDFVSINSDTSVRGFFDRLIVRMSGMSISTNSNVDGAKYYPAVGNMVIHPTQADPYDVPHELVHAVDDFHDWFIKPIGSDDTKAEALAYAAVDHMLMARHLDIGTFTGTEINSVGSAQIRWNSFWGNISNLNSQPVVVGGAEVRKVVWGDVTDVRNKLKLGFSAASLLPVYNKFLLRKGFQPNSLSNTFTSFNLHPAFR